MPEEELMQVKEYPSDVHILFRNDKQYILLGTAHISKASADLVKTVIEKELPDKVCVELDQQRFKALSEKKRWESLDLKTVIREKQLTTLIVNLLLASYQKKLGEKLGVVPGVELLQAVSTAQQHNIAFDLCDRDVRITLKRAWNSMSFFQKLKFVSSGLAGIFNNVEITDEKLEQLKQKDLLTEMMSELGRVMPVIKKVIVDERDQYLAQKIKNTDGNKIVAVVGAGHIEGIKHILNDESGEIDLSAIEVIPSASTWMKWIGWLVPAIIVGSLLYIGFNKGLNEAGSNFLYWILANGIPSSLGAIFAAGHPFTIIAAFFAAPFTSLSPVIGAGYIAAFVQVYYQPPLVSEIHSVIDDAGKIKMWWHNKLLKVLLVFLLAGTGSIIGTYIGAYEIISNLF